MHEIRRIDPARTARLLAIIYAALFGLLTIFMVPMLLLAPTPSQGPPPPKAFLVVMFILYPLLGAAMGWLTGQATSRIYNWASGRYGGLLMEIRPVQSTADRQLTG